MIPIAKNLLLATLVLAIPTAAIAQEAGGRKKSPVKVEMERLDEALDAVGDYLKEPKGDAPLAQIAAAQAALQESKKHPPGTLEQQPEEKRAEFLAAYKIKINETIRVLLDLEDALLQNKTEDAGKAMQALKELKKTGHRTFKPRRRRRG